MPPKPYKAPSMQEIYDRLTASLIERMEQGETPWARSWRSKGLARNATTQKPYRGFNQLVLQALGAKYESPYWLTYNQAGELGGNVKAGEKGTPVIFWKILKPFGSKAAPDGGGAAADCASEPEATEMALTSKVPGRGIPLLRYYTVFNADQCENLKTKIDLHPGRNLTPPTPTEAHAAADELIARAEMCPILTNGHDPCYVPALDEIWLPTKGQFPHPDDYYQVCLHEMAHASGHASRLGRLDRSTDVVSDMRRDSYAKEELVAEMSAAFLSSQVGLDMARITERSGAYLRGWAKRCRQEPELLINAAQQAQKATDWILGLTPEQEKRRQQKESDPVVLAPPVPDAIPVPAYEVEDRRPFQAGDVVRYYQPGTKDFAIGILSAGSERTYTIGGLVDLPKDQVFSLATKAEAEAHELYVFDVNHADDADGQAAKGQAARWSHLNLTPVQSPQSGNWICTKMKGYPVKSVMAPVGDTCLYIDEDPAYRHVTEGDVFLGQLHSPAGRADLYFTRKGHKTEAVVRRSSDEKDCVRCTSAAGLTPEFAIALDRANRVIEAQKERDKITPEAIEAPSL